MKIFINPGHCPGVDSGAVNKRYGETEAALVAKIGAIVKSDLDAVGYDTQLVQVDSLGEICRAANGWNADLFVSIHVNACNGTAEGTETFCYARGGRAEKLAECVQAQIIDNLHTEDRGVRTAGYYVLTYTNMPAILVECEFIDNNKSCKLLTEKYTDFAHAIARGITDYVG